MRISIGILLLLVSLFHTGCKGPPVPPEVRQAEIQEHNLWRAGSSLYAPADYSRYRENYKRAKEELIKEKSKFAWFRDYQEVANLYRHVLRNGEKVLKKVQEEKQKKANILSNNIVSFKERIKAIKKLSLMVNEGNFARIILIHAELKLMEGEYLFKRGEFLEAEKKLESVSVYVQDVENMLFSALDRFNDETFIIKWRKWAEEAIFESKKKQIFVIIVSKLNQKLTLYKNGKLFSSYDVSFGINGFNDKLHAGDYATPEGRYRIIKKRSTSNFHKALLINYPNEEDREKFNLAKKSGLLPPGVGIGGWIEIHGGGKDSITYGCISLDNEDIDEIFSLVEVGTPVIIVGNLHSIHTILLKIKEK